MTFRKNDLKNEGHEHLTGIRQLNSFVKAHTCQYNCDSKSDDLVAIANNLKVLETFTLNKNVEDRRDLLVNLNVPDVDYGSKP